MASIRVFISYSTVDRALAERLYGDLRAGGADAFQFEQTAEAGKPSWEQIIDWINDSDVFVVLLTSAALQSPAVKAEIEQAHYAHINAGKPEKLIPARAEDRVPVPKLIERFTSVDFFDYDSGADRLRRELGLATAVSALVPVAAPRVDWDAIFSQYKEEHPEPTPVEAWNREALGLLSRFEKGKPADLEPEEERQLVAGFLWPTGLQAKPSSSTSLFRGGDPSMARYAALFGSSAATPAPASAASVIEGQRYLHMARPGETIHELAERFGTTPDAIREASSNFAENLPASDIRVIDEHGILYIPQGRHQVYTPVAGDTLASVAHRFGVLEADLRALNDMVDYDLSPIGHLLVIPAPRDQ